MSSEKDTIEINFINLTKEQIIEQLTPKNLNQWENADIILIINDKEYNSLVKANTNVAISFEIKGEGVYPNNKPNIIFKKDQIKDNMQLVGLLSKQLLDKIIIVPKVSEDEDIVIETAIDIDNVSEKQETTISLETKEVEKEDIQTSDIEDELSDDEFEGELLIVDNIETKTVEEVTEKQNLSIWQRQMNNEKRNTLINEFLHEHYSNKINLNIIDLETKLFSDLIDNTFNDILNENVAEFKPLHSNLNNNRFKNTNIYPIVEDKKILYMNNELLDREDDVNNYFTVYPQIDNLELQTLGNVNLKIRLIKKHHNGQINYEQLIHSLYNSGQMNITNDDGDDVEVNYGSSFSSRFYRHIQNTHYHFP